MVFCHLPQTTSQHQNICTIFIACQICKPGIKISAGHHQSAASRDGVRCSCSSRVSGFFKVAPRCVASMCAHIQRSIVRLIWNRCVRSHTQSYVECYWLSIKLLCEILCTPSCGVAVGCHHVAARKNGLLRLLVVTCLHVS